MCLDNEKCFSQDIIDNLTEYVFLDFITVDFTIHSFNNIVKFETTQKDRHMLSRTVYKRIWFYLSEIRFVTDKDLVFTNYDREVFSQYDSMRYDNDLRDLNSGSIPGTFASLTILNTGFIFSYDRKYLKLVDYLTSMGGMAKFLQICAFLLNYVYSLNSYNLQLIKNLQIKSTSNQNHPFNPLTNEIAILKPEKTYLDNKSNKKEINDSKMNIHCEKMLDQVDIIRKLRKSYYKLLPIRFFPRKYKQFLMNCIVKIYTMLNISNIIMKIEENNLLLNEIIKEKKTKMYSGLNDVLPKLRLMKTISINNNTNLQSLAKS